MRLLYLSCLPPPEVGGVGFDYPIFTEPDSRLAELR